MTVPFDEGGAYGAEILYLPGDGDNGCRIALSIHVARSECCRSHGCCWCPDGYHRRLDGDARHDDITPPPTVTDPVYGRGDPHPVERTEHHG